MDFKSSIISESYIIIQLDNLKGLIASGINFSLSNENSFTILGKHFSLENQYLGFSLQDVKKHLNIEVDYVIGSNVLSKFNYKINKKKKEFIFSTDAFKTEDCFPAIPLTYNFDIPNIPIQINNLGITAIFNTLSNYCYVNEKNLQTMTEIAEKEDFMIGMGNFKAKLFQANYNIGGNDVILETGFYPSVISKSRFLAIDKGIIGSEVLSKYVVIVNSQNNQFFIQ